MNEFNYELDKSDYKQKVDNESWQEIDNNLPSIPQGVYNFKPSSQNKIYYQRFLYCLYNQYEEQKAYHLSAYILCLNLNNYYALMLRNSSRKRIWQNIQSNEEYANNLKQELQFANCLLDDNPKQYQLWNYKKDLISEISNSSHQIDMEGLEKEQQAFIFHLLTNDDSKNYHAWDFYTWLTRFFGNFERKIIETDQMLFTQSRKAGEFVGESFWKDCYSCWSYRFNLIMELPEEKKSKYVQQDSQKMLKLIYKDPQNQCAWNYLTGLVESPVMKPIQRQKIIQQIYGICSKVSQQNRYAWVFLLQVGSQQIKEEALSKLSEIDPIREFYYQYIKQIGVSSSS